MTEPRPRARRRSAAPRLAAPIAGFTLPPLVLAACAGGGVQAAAAQQQLVTVADRIDACFAQRADVRQCSDPKVLGDLGDATLGAGAGEIDLNASSATRYQLTIEADGGTSFAILSQPVGARKRVCRPAGRDGCPTGGKW